MVIVKLNGGLGNQMFQYALYQAFLEKGISAKLDRSKYSCLDEKRECFLDYPCFRLDYELCTRKEAREYVLGTGMMARVFIKLFGDKQTHIYEKAEYEYDATLFETREGYLDGFWQTWKYMNSESIKERVRKQFAFVNPMPDQAEAYESGIKQTNAVAVHIRRGDYLELKEIYGGICTADYYRRAMEEIRKSTEQPIFYFFSDDMEWTKQTFGIKDDYVFVDGKGLWQDYTDMQLMSECKHQIMANSSFSWWAAFLNSHQDKKIICPAKWINQKDTPDIYCEEWIRVEEYGEEE